MGATMGHVLGMPNGAAWLPAPGVNVFSMPLTAHDASGQPLQVPRERTVSAREPSSYPRSRPWPDYGSAHASSACWQVGIAVEEPFLTQLLHDSWINMQERSTQGVR